MMYSAYKLNKQGDNIQLWHTPFLIWNQSVVLCPVLAVASWAIYRFLRRQVRWSGIPISWRISQFVVIHTVNGFGIVNKTEIDVFSGTLLLCQWSSANLNSAFKWVYLSFSPLPFTSLFSAICKASPDNHFAFLHLFFWGMVLISVSCTVLQISVHSSSGTLSDLIP